VSLPTVELAELKKPKTGVVPQDALDFFKRKKLKPSFSYKEVWAEEHAAAFTVAKIMELDILRHVQDSLTTALAEGQTFETWKKTVAPSLEKSGWSSHVSDKQKPSRLRLIFETNMRVARAVGQDERAQRTKKDLPYFVFEPGPSKIKREEHKALYGVIRPVDDPFWKEHTPPLGYGCKCRLRQITQREADSKGGVKEPPQEERVEWKLPNGRTTSAPAGVHPTFAYPKTTEERLKRLNQGLSEAQKGQDGPKEIDSEGASRRDNVELTHLVSEVDAKRSDPHEIALSLSDGARRKLRELIELCPGEFDTTGVSKFPGDEKTTRRHLQGELARHGLIAQRNSQSRLGLYPTSTAREVYRILTSPA
jgi:hypothetical protein